MAHGNPRSRRQRVCPWCFKPFTKEEHLARHVRSHTREKPFVCTVCRKAFSRHDSLLRHSRLHSSHGELETAVGGNTMVDVSNDTQNMASSVPSFDQATFERAEPSPRTQPHANTGILDPTSSGNSAMLPSNAGNRPRSSEWLTTLIGLPDHGLDPYPSNLEPSLGDPNDNNNWGFGDLVSQTPVWMVNHDFDLDALNSAILADTTNCLPINDQNEIGTTNGYSQSAADAQQISKEELVRKQWFTFIGPPESGYVTPDTLPEKTHIDEAYRQRLGTQLQQRILTMALPSTDFLNLCIRMYFTRFNPIFPIVHAPTFRPSAKSSLLLLSICSIGSLFVGSSHATSQGMKIFETLNKAILSSWEKYISRDGPEAVAMIQAALIGQTFGLLSGRPKDLLTTQTFHGTVVAWARRYNMFKVGRASDYISNDELTSNPKKAWESWIQVEEQNRLVTGLHIHDVEISELFFTEPFLQHGSPNLPLIAEDSLWEAPCEKNWSALIMNNLLDRRVSGDSMQAGESLPQQLRTTDRCNRLDKYLELEGITASIANGQGMGSSNKREHHEALLLQFYESHLKSRVGKPDHYCLMALWHSAFMSLYASFNRLELAVGRKGFDEPRSHVDYAHEWANSKDGQRCALHAALILREIERMSLKAEPPIHVPRTIFRAAIVWFCYTSFGADALENQMVEFPELNKMGINCQRLLFEANGFKTSRPNTYESSTLCGLVDILHRVGHWGISRKFASILTVLLPEGSEA